MFYISEHCWVFASARDGFKEIIPGLKWHPYSQSGKSDGLTLMRSLTRQALALGRRPLPLPERWDEAGICSHCEAEVRANAPYDLALK